MTKIQTAPRAVWPLVTAAEMRALDAHTIETLGVPGEVLMESAGRAVVEAVLSERPPGAPVAVICGAGNNGGDGLVIARHLHLLGVPVRAILLAEASLKGDAALQLARSRAVGVSHESGGAASLDGLTGGVLVDAIFGTGLSRDVTGEPADVIGRINAVRSRDGVRVVAVDVPSGVCSDTGAILGVAVRADVTIALSLPKRGLALEPGRSVAGVCRVARIGIADRTPDLAPRAELWTRAEAGRVLPARPAAGHKGTFGHALIVAGSEGKTGAAALAAHGAARAGAGLVTLACPAGLNDILEVHCTEAMTSPVPDTAERALAASAEAAIVSLAATRDAVGLGPGVGRSEETSLLMRALVKGLEVPLAIDADGLLAFAADPALIRGRAAPTVLTPHPGEAAQLLGSDAATLNRDRAGAAQSLAERTGSIVALKGAATVIAAPDGRLAVNPTGGPNLATGGTGDVLLGLVTGYLAQGVDPFDAATLAVFVHGAAADRIAGRQGGSGMLAGDLLPEIPPTVAELGTEASRATVTGRGISIHFPEP